MQFHDQLTAGIPGLLPLYIGLQARVTEKIAKGKKLTILKHQSCEVIGWELHPADRVHDESSQRLLSYLPLVIYLKFEKATWRIHPALDVGVFPLKPVQRQWTVNNNSDAKVTRKGFTLVPDLASTAFMIQGTTLPAEIAECGDVFAMPGLTEMVTTYVILSRVRCADSLLLLRAFSPYLFRVGSPPGPACLLKLLHHRLGRKESLPGSARDRNAQCSVCSKPFSGLGPRSSYGLGPRSSCSV